MQSTDIPLLTAFVLGLLVAFNPCQLSINISALSYIVRKEKESKMKVDKENNHHHTPFNNSISYAIGRTITYTILGWIMMCLIGGGHNINGFKEIVSLAEIVLPYILIAIGLFLLFRTFHHHEHHGDSCHNSGQIIKRNGPLGSLFLGMTLALAFCPESAIFYFGIMLPMAMTTEVGIAVPLVFALAASIPVLIVSWIMHKATDKIEKFSHTFEHFQQILNGITGVLFIIIAILLLLDI